MKTFSIHSTIVEFENFGQFAEAFALNERDLILTNQFIYEPFIQPTGVSCPPVFQEKYGAGEPTDVMIDAICADIPDGIERIIAVGGGTVIDIAKVLILSGDGNAEDKFMKRCPVGKARQLIAVPTTCGTGSEVTNVAVTALTRQNTKMGLALDCMYPDQAVLIPQLVATLPYQFFATSSVDALVHCVESYLSPKATDYSQTFSVKGIDTIVRHYRKVVEAGLETWSDHAAAFLRASNYGGIAFGNAGCAAVHAMSYPLSGKYHIPHGEANMLMFEAVIRHYLKLDPNGRIVNLGRVLAEAFDLNPSGDDWNAGVFLSGLAQSALEVTGPAGIWDRLFNLLDAVLKRSPLNTYGVQRDELEDFCDSVIAGQQRLLGNNYVKLDKSDMMAIYLSCYDR